MGEHEVLVEHEVKREGLAECVGADPGLLSAVLLKAIEVFIERLLLRVLLLNEKLDVVALFTFLLDHLQQVKSVHLGKLRLIWDLKKKNLHGTSTVGIIVLCPNYGIRRLINDILWVLWASGMLTSSCCLCTLLPQQQRLIFPENWVSHLEHLPFSAFFSPIFSIYFSFTRRTKEK